jgi:Protein of unknown function (DUF2012)
VFFIQLNTFRLRAATMLGFYALFLVCSQVLFAVALDIRGTIASNSHLLSPALLPPSTLLILSSPNLEYRTHPSPNGKFAFHNVSTEGNPSYLLQVECITHKFPQMRIDIGDNDVDGVYQSFRMNKWNHKANTLPYPIEIAVTGTADFYAVRLLKFLH